METKPEVEMSDIANETQEPVTVSVEDLVNSIEKGDAFTSSKIFKDIVQSRIDDALEQEQKKGQPRFRATSSGSGESRSRIKIYLKHNGRRQTV